MSKKPRRVKLLVGFSNWAGPKWRKDISYKSTYKKAAIDEKLHLETAKIRLVAVSLDSTREGQTLISIGIRI